MNNLVGVLIGSALLALAGSVAQLSTTSGYQDLGALLMWVDLIVFILACVATGMVAARPKVQLPIKPD